MESEAAILWEVSGYERLLVMPLHVGAADREREALILPPQLFKGREFAWIPISISEEQWGNGV